LRFFTATVVWVGQPLKYALKTKINGTLDHGHYYELMREQIPNKLNCSFNKKFNMLFVVNFFNKKMPKNSYVYISWQ